MQQSAVILITDDDSSIRAMLKIVLGNAGFCTLEAENGLQAVQTCREQDVDLVVMDVMMPVLDGYEACRLIRQFSSLPVIFLTVRANEDDIELGFNVGAHDFLSKPFRPRELVARIRSLLKREPTQHNRNAQVLLYDDLALDPRSHEVHRGNELLEVTAMSYQILAYFMKNAGRVISKDELLREVWSYTNPVGSKNMVEAAIKRLRKDLGDDPRAPRYIRTVWGIGYRFGKKPEK